MRTLKIVAGVLLLVGGLGVFGYTLVNATIIAPQEPAAGGSAQSVVAQGDIPSQLSIPSLGINAKVQQTGLTKSGAMGTPTNFTDVAWFKNGPAPGQVGSAVIDGHVDNGLSLAGVFKHLADIKMGDDVYVTTQSGQQLHFKVSDIEIYPYKDAPSNLIFEQNDAVRLNLITCDGTWVKGDRTYNERLVVYTTLVS
jgi:sortase A